MVLLVDWNFADESDQGQTLEDVWLKVVPALLNTGQDISENWNEQIKS